MNAVHVASILESRIFRLDLLDHLLAKRTHFRGTRDDYVLTTLEAEVARKKEEEN